ncbi:MAG: ATP-binding protein [Steroidobacteraceae bacterium]
MAGKNSVGAPRADRRGLLRLGTSPALDWVLLAYAAVVIGIGWAYTGSRIHGDYEQTLDEERTRLRSVAATLQAGTLAMLNDGVGAAVAGANELQAEGGLILASRLEIITTLRKQLAGGSYVRSLFLTDGERFALATRDGAFGGRLTPEWLTVAQVPASSGTWVGSPIVDPERPDMSVIPIAQRVTWGKDLTLWAGALFSFDGFEGLYRQSSDQIASMGLIASDGTLLVRVPGTLELPAGANLASNDLFKRAIAQGNEGIVEGYGSVAKKDMIYAYDLMNGYPIYIMAGQSRDAALAPWRSRRRVAVGTTAAFSALVLGMTALLNHSLRALRRRDHHYRTLFNNAQFSVFLLEGDRFVDANRTAIRMFGLQSEREAIGLSPWDLSPEHQPDGQRSEDLARARIETALREGGTSFEWLHRRLDNDMSFPAEVGLSTIKDGNTVLALAVVRDQTARKRAEHDLQLLSAELMRSQDEERRRIGRDLHDSTGQTLAALELGLARLMHDTGSATAARRELLEHCARLATQCSTEIRTASYLLHPPLLDELGLLSALRWLADGFRQRSAVEVRLDLPQTMDRLPRDSELCLFRVAQEALTNVHRHAASPWVTIRLKVQSDSVMLEVEDAGRGLPRAGDPATPGSGPLLGVGLAGMRERMRQIGGTLSVESTSRGTRVRSTLYIGQPPPAVST